MYEIKEGFSIHEKPLAVYAAWDDTTAGALLVMSNHCIYIWDKRPAHVDEDGVGNPGPLALNVYDDACDWLKTKRRPSWWDNVHVKIMPLKSLEFMTLI